MTERVNTFLQDLLKSLITIAIVLVHRLYQDRLVGDEVSVDAIGDLTRTEFGCLGVNLHKMQF
jgi:hypothetical protein